MSRASPVMRDSSVRPLTVARARNRFKPEGQVTDRGAESGRGASVVVKSLI
jgi:hypothetical protein